MTYRSGRIPGWDGFLFQPGQVWTPANELVLSNEVEHYRWMTNELGNSERRALIHPELKNYRQLEHVI